MGVLTVVISDDVEEKLRKFVDETYGSAKGSLSKVIEDALRNYLQSSVKKEKVYRAYKEKNLVEEAKSITELAEKLKNRSLDPRGLRIIAIPGIKKRARAGYRLKT